MKFRGSGLHPVLRISLLVYLAALFCLSGKAQSQTAGRLCPLCKTTGKVENPYMKEELCALEKDALYCSHIIEKDKKGHGITWLPCQRCRNPELEEAARKEFDSLVEEKEKWLSERRRMVDDRLDLEDELLHLETEHFIIVWNIKKIVTKDKKTYKMHEAMHLYAQRLEQFYSDFMKELGLKEEEMRNHKHKLYLFEEQKQCLKGAKEFTGLNCWNSAKLPGRESTLVSWKDHEMLKTDEAFHRHLIHHISHLLNVAYYRMEWLTVDAGWADEGLGHYFEMKYFNKADNSCDEEGEEEDFSHIDWEYEVRNALTEEKNPSFADISVKSTTALHGDDHKYAWSYVDFLMDRDPLKFKIFMKAIKDRRSAREGLKEAYGLNFIQFQQDWEEYVLGNYRTKPLKSPTAPRRRRFQ